jgi:hypothetical protein
MFLFLTPFDPPLAGMMAITARFINHPSQSC